MFRSYGLHPVALDGNPEPDLVHATGCKQPTLRYIQAFEKDLYNGIPNITSWQVLQNRLKLKAYKLSIFLHLKDG
jgi:hypothetical protein